MKKLFLVEGDAGSGKTMLTNLMCSEVEVITLEGSGVHIDNSEADIFALEFNPKDYRMAMNIALESFPKDEWLWFHISIRSINK